MKLYLRLLKYVKLFWIAFAIAIIANILYSSIDASLTYMLKPLLNKGFIDRDSAFIDMVPFFIIIIFIFRGITGFLSTYCLTWVARNVVMVFRQEIFSKLLLLPSTYYDNNSSGEILSKIIFNVEQVADAGAEALTTMVQSGALVIGLLVVMFTISWRLTCLYLIIAPIVAFIIKVSSKRMRRLSEEIQHVMGEVSHVAEESIEGYRVVRTYGGEKFEDDKFKLVTKKNRQREMKVVTTKAASTAAVQFFAALVLAGTIYIAVTHFKTFGLSAGSFVSLMTSMLFILKPLKRLTTVNGKIQKGLAGAKSVFQVLDEKEEQDTGTIQLDRADGLIEYKHIGFAYQDKHVVIDDISFTVKPGQTVAFVGKSGSGKSTLMSLLMRFYELSSGEILVDDNNITDYTLKSLRKQFAYVSQEVNLFNDTVANNIAYGLNRDIPEEDIKSAAVAAHAWEFIKDLPNGLNTHIGENGVLLSGGQRQRLAIARAFLKKAPIIILDEATSALDTASERHIQSAIDELIKDSTTLVIAHRLSTIENADKIIVMDGGKIVEQGSHSELIQNNHIYAQLHSMQFKEV